MRNPRRPATLLLLAAALHAAPADAALPIRLPAPPVEMRATGERLYQALQKQAGYLHKEVRPWADDESLKLLTESRSEEHWVRPNTAALVGFATLCRWGPYDAGVVGVSRDELLRGAVVPMMRYLVATHASGDRVTSDGRPWGDAWQSAHWTVAIARAAWFVWDDLPADVRSGVCRVVAHEASRFLDATPPSGMRVDTKSEENAWNSRIFCVAVSLMPDDPRRDAWERAFLKWSMSSFLRPSDERRDTVVEGRPVSDWFLGANVLEDFTCENHGIVHPGYMGCIGISLGCHLDYAMSGRQAPATIAWNAAGVYDNLKFMATPDGNYAYPSGQDWTLFRNPQKAYLHLLMAAFEGDPDGWSLANDCWDAMDKMQARSADGRVFLPDEYFFASMQHDTLERFALQWLALHFADSVADEPTRPTGVRHLPHAKLILQRTADAFVTVSYGARAMVQVTALDLDRVVSPDFRALVGEVRVAGETEPPEPAVAHAEVDAADDRFSATLVVDHGDAARARLTLRTDAAGALRVEEELTALRDVELTRVATGLVGVLNNKNWVYESGERRVDVDGVRHTIAAESGAWIAADARRIDVDGVLRIETGAERPIRYFAANGPERGRATDRLYLNHADEARACRAGEVISRYTATIRITPGAPDSGGAPEATAGR